MTPPSESACHGCALHERRGVCPTAREAYGFENTVAEQRKADELYAAIRQDAEAVRSLRELIHDGMQVALPIPAQVALPRRSKTRVMPHDSRKERIHADRSHNTIH
jgi:hypothetical protein